MNSETIKQVTTQAIEHLVEALNSGHSEVLRQYLRAMAKFRHYSLLNVLLILKACPTASRVAGFKTWQSLGRQVKPGEKGILILAPMFRRATEQNAESDDPKAPRRLSGFRAVHVWDEQQTTGNELPKLTTVAGDPSVHLARLEQFVRENGIRLEYATGIAPARGMAEKGKITVRPDLTAAETFATLVHELAHADLHFGARRAHTNTRIRETEAEAVAYVVCSAIGLETRSASADYLSLYGADSKVLMNSLEYVQTTAARILTGMEPDAAQHAA